MQPAKGHLLWFNTEKGHGFIETDEGERLYVAASGLTDALPDGTRAGLAVEFQIVEGPRGRRAEDTRLVPDISPRRARRRHTR